jgi:hypothetical protein
VTPRPARTVRGFAFQAFFTIQNPARPLFELFPLDSRRATPETMFYCNGDVASDRHLVLTYWGSILGQTEFEKSSSVPGEDRQLASSERLPQNSKKVAANLHGRIAEQITKQSAPVGAVKIRGS